MLQLVVTSILHLCTVTHSSFHHWILVILEVYISVKYCSNQFYLLQLKEILVFQFQVCRYIFTLCTYVCSLQLINHVASYCICIIVLYIFKSQCFCIQYMYLFHTGSKCSGNPYLDVVFVIDASDGPYFFERLQEFTANLTAELIPTSPRISIGVILYQDDAAIQFNLQAYDNLNALLSAIDQLTYNGGRTDTAKALRLLLSTAQNGELGLRNSSAKVAIVLTDGYSYYPSETSSAVAALHASNIFDVYAIGLYGSSLYRLQGIASSPEFVFLLYSLGNTVLQQLQDRLLPQLCKGK